MDKDSTLTQLNSLLEQEGTTTAVFRDGLEKILPDNPDEREWIRLWAQSLRAFGQIDGIAQIIQTEDAEAALISVVAELASVSKQIDVVKARLDLSRQKSKDTEPQA